MTDDAHIAEQPTTLEAVAAGLLYSVLQQPQVETLEGGLESLGAVLGAQLVGLRVRGVGTWLQTLAFWSCDSATRYPLVVNLRDFSPVVKELLASGAMLRSPHVGSDLRLSDDSLPWLGPALTLVPVVEGGVVQAVLHLGGAPGWQPADEQVGELMSVARALYAASTLLPGASEGDSRPFDAVVGSVLGRLTGPADEPLRQLPDILRRIGPVLGLSSVSVWRPCEGGEASPLVAWPEEQAELLKQDVPQPLAHGIQQQLLRDETVFLGDTTADDPVSEVLTLHAEMGWVDGCLRGVVSEGELLGSVLLGTVDPLNRERKRAVALVVAALAGYLVRALGPRQLSDNTMRAAMDLGQMAVLQVSSAGHGAAGPRWEALHGASSARGTRAYLEHIHPDDRSAAQRELERLLRGQGEATAEVVYRLALAPHRVMLDRWRRRDLDARGWALDCVSVPVPANAGPSGGAWRDLLHATLDRVPLSAVYVDQSGVVQYANSAFEGVFRQSPSAVVGASVVQVLGPGLGEQVQPRVQAALGGELAKDEGEIPLPDGTVLRYRNQVVPHRDGENVRGMVLLTQDLSGGAPAGVLSSGDMASLVLGELETALLVADSSGAVRFASPNLGSVAGITAGAAWEMGTIRAVLGANVIPPRLDEDTPHVVDRRRTFPDGRSVPLRIRVRKLGPDRDDVALFVQQGPVKRREAAPSSAPAPAPPSDLVVGSSPAFSRCLQQADLVAQAPATVLVTGETGVGKELVARRIHASSPRASKQLVTVNCGALSPTIVESELFGHERGAFTGAIRARVGALEAAHGGTLFLDEVGELPLELQPKLLRALEYGELQRVGSSEVRRFDARLVAATHRDLRAMVEEGTFREDLYYRLAVIPIEVPPLRERISDIPALAAHFSRLLAARMGREPVRFSPRFLDALKAQPLRGNVRELKNLVERAVVLGEQTLLGGETAAPSAVPEPSFGGGSDRILTEEDLRALERDNLQRALERCGWQVSGAGGAAELLGIPANTLRSRMRRFSLTPPSR